MAAFLLARSRLGAPASLHTVLMHGSVVGVLAVPSQRWLAVSGDARMQPGAPAAHRQRPRQQQQQQQQRPRPPARHSDRSKPPPQSGKPRSRSSSVLTGVVKDVSAANAAARAALLQTTDVWRPPELVSNPKSLNVAIVGAPNAGKSSLVNRLVGSVVSAVSPKYNTTRDKTMGILTTGNTQLVFYDTPGFVDTAMFGKKFFRPLVVAVEQTVPLAHVVVLVYDIARRWEVDDTFTLQRMVSLADSVGSRLLIVANKADRVSRKLLDEKIEHLFDAWDDAASAAKVPSPEQRLEATTSTTGTPPASFKAIMDSGSWDSDTTPADSSADADKPVKRVHPPEVTDALQGVSIPSLFVTSARTGAGVQDLRQALCKLALPRPWEYASTIVTDQTDQERAQEVVRGGLFHVLQAEVPYQTKIETTAWRPTPEKLFIYLDVQVPSKRHARMLLSRGQAPLNIVRDHAQQDLERMFGLPVQLNLHVAIKPDILKRAQQ